MAKSGYHRSPTAYIIVQAFAEIWYSFPQPRLLASFVRSGHIDRLFAAVLAKCSLATVADYIADLQKRQTEITELNHWAHPNQTPSRRAQASEDQVFSRAE